MGMESFKSIVRSLCPPLIWRGLGRLRDGPESQSTPQEIEIARLRHMPGATPTVVETLLGRPFRTDRRLQVPFDLPCGQNLDGPR